MKTRFLPFTVLFLVCFSALAEESSEEVLVEYIPMDPNFVVNLLGNRRSYLRTNIQLLVEGKPQAERITIHMPAIRHALILLMSEYSADQLGTQEQREQFRKEALTQTRKTLDKVASSKGLSDLFFTEFLVQ